VFLSMLKTQKNITMKNFLIAFFTLASFHVVAQETIINDANAQKRSLQASFSAIKVSSGINLFITQGTEESVAVSASEAKHLERLKTVVENGVLKIYYDNNGVSWKNERRSLKAYVSFKTLEKLHGSSGASVHAKSVLKLASLSLDFSSGSAFEGEVAVEKLFASQDSGSEIIITGKADRLSVDVSSGAIFKGFELLAEYCAAKASSGADARVSVNKELEAKASSGGGIKYKGAAVLSDLNVSSGGMVKKS
jgi:hypothetical protein